MVILKIKLISFPLVLLFCFHSVFAVDNDDNRIPLKVLLVAEPYGYGPAASLAQLMSKLRTSVSYIGYAGTGHTLDMHQKLPYNEIHTISSEHVDFNHIVKNYDVLITTTDFTAVEKAKKNNLKIIVYDPLFWYWDEIPNAIKLSDLYIVQDFISVKERVEKHPSYNIRTIPPVVQTGYKISKNRNNCVHVSVGGLFNPLVSKDDLANYASQIGQTLLKQEFPYYLLGNKSLKKMTGLNYSQVSPEKSQELLASSKLAVMTPGLGHILESHQNKTPVIWLPPTNPSQARQLHLMVEHGYTNTYIDWHHFMDIKKIDYNLPEHEVMKVLAKVIKKFGSNNRYQDEFHAVLLEKLHSSENTLSKNLISEYGNNGLEQLNLEIVNYLNRIYKDEHNNV
ncbi:MAG: hypothetical protein HON32_03030 [Francisellaceae bacterium]|jgi:hypothetical protein|nr:hypothetical protein [Francisellaceae bacterium]